MTQPPDLLLFMDEWSAYEDRVYEAFLESFVRGNVQFRRWPVKAQFRPETRGKGFSFWHTISEAPSPQNRNENDRIPDLRRCERIRWIAWAIQQANIGQDGFSWWENRRGRETRVVIWAEHHNFAVILAKRRDYYLLKTAYSGLNSRRLENFRRERDEFYRHQKG